MHKLPVISGKELVAALKKTGFVEVRQRGSHLSLQKITLNKTYKTVVPMHQELSKGTLIDILRQTGLRITSGLIPSFSKEGYSPCNPIITII